MAHPFSVTEKEVITKALMQRGRELFGTLGLQKTSVAELAKAAGIAQGSFYSFFGSKEELLFALVEEEEKKIHSAFTDLLSGILTRDKLKLLLVNGLAVAESNTIIRQLMDPEIYQRVIRKLPEDKVRRHIERDSADLAPLIEHWQAQGFIGGHRPDVVSGLLRAVFTIALHKQEIGEDIFPEVVELLAETIAIGLVKEET